MWRIVSEKHVIERFVQKYFLLFYRPRVFEHRSLDERLRALGNVHVGRLRIRTSVNVRKTCLKQVQ